MVSMLERLVHPLVELREWGAHVAHERAERAAEHEAENWARHAQQIEQALAAYADAVQFKPRPYRELSAGEVRFGNTPAFEYFHHTGELRLFNILPPPILTRAALTEALGLRIDEDGESIGDIVDVKPHEIPPFEYGAINLTARELREAHGASWRMYLTITYSAVQGSFRGGIQMRRFAVDVTL